jgi:hypothetical protein
MLPQMPEAFNNRYTFPALQAVPALDAIAASLEQAFQTKLTRQFARAGDQGAPRDWAHLSNDDIEMWVFWETGRPMVELQVLDPIDRMFIANSAMASLGAVAESDDSEWRRRIAARRRGRLMRFLGIAVAASSAVAVMWVWGWWGLLAVVLLTIAAAVVWTIGLASAFQRP